MGSIPETQFQKNFHGKFVRLWTANSRKIYAYLLTLVPQRSDAEDLLQEVGVVAWEKFGEFDQSKDFVAWARGIARNKAMNFLHKSKRYRQPPAGLVEQIHEEVSSMSGLLERQHEALERCLTRLSDKDRDLLRLRYAPGLAVPELAEQTGRSVAAIYKALQRIHDRLLQCVEQVLATEGLS